MIKKVLISAAIALQLMPQPLLAQQAAAVRNTQAQAQHTCIWVHLPCDRCSCMGCAYGHIFCDCLSGEGVCILCNAHSKLSAQEWRANSTHIEDEDFQKIQNEIAIHQEAQKKIKHDPTLSYAKARAQAKAENHQRWMERIQQDMQQAEQDDPWRQYNGIFAQGAAYQVYSLGKSIYNCFR